MTKVCLECSDPISGRIDKKFCSDQCRNDHNNHLNYNNNMYVRKVNNILRKNRRILAFLNPKGKSRVHKNVLLENGFNFQYFTNTCNGKNKNVYFFCYDHGYLPIKNDYYNLIIKQ